VIELESQAVTSIAEDGDGSTKAEDGGRSTQGNGSTQVEEQALQKHPDPR